MITSVLVNVGLLFLYMVIGFGVGKVQSKVLKYSKILSKVLIYVLCPCMIISSFTRMEYSKETFKEISIFFAISLLAQIAFFLILYFIFHKRIKEPKYRIFSIASVLGNVGFLGLPIITGIFPNEPIVACYSCVFVVSMNLLVFTLGVFMITDDKKYISIKSALLNPTTISFAIALPLFLFNVKFPEIVSLDMKRIASLVTPVCMLVLGGRLSQMKLKDVFTSKIGYLTCLTKLVIFPFFALLLVIFIPGLLLVFKCSIFVLCAMPSGAIISTLAEIHECEREEAANVVLLTTLLSIITIPLIVLIAGIL